METSTPISTWLRGFVVVILAVTHTTCGKSPASPTPVNLAGSWSGLLGQPQSGTALRMSWVATQSGNDVSGSATLIKPAFNIALAGTLTGTLSGTQVSLRFSAPAGNVPGFVNCAASASGSASVAANTISGNLGVTFMSCEPLGIEPLTSNQLNLTRQ